LDFGRLNNIDARDEKDLEKTLSLCSRKAANENNYKHKLRVEGEPTPLIRLLNIEF